MNTQPDVSDLLRRVQRLEDIECARNALHKYAATLDSPTPESAAALFTDDGVLRTRLGEFRGHDAIAAFFRDRFLAEKSEKRHFIVNPRTTWLSPGRVAIDSYFLFTGRSDGRSIIGWGTYRDVVRIVDGEAYVEDKTISLDVNTELTTGWASD